MKKNEQHVNNAYRKQLGSKKAIWIQKLLNHKNPLKLKINIFDKLIEILTDYLYSTTLFLPVLFALYSASSAIFINSSISSVSLGNSAMPILSVTLTD
ncbi:hypothetical protein ES705_37352 [subsurface metagenome]